MESAQVVTAWATMALAAIALLTLGAIIYVGFVQLRQLQQDSHNRIIKNFLESWESDSMAESRRAFQEAIRPPADTSAPMEYDNQSIQEAMNLKNALDKFKKDNDPKFYAIIRIGNYMETISYMMKSKADKKLLRDLMQGPVLYYFIRFKPWVDQYRKESPELFRWFEKLFHFCESEPR